MTITLLIVNVQQRSWAANWKSACVSPVDILQLHCKRIWCQLICAAKKLSSQLKSKISLRKSRRLPICSCSFRNRIKADGLYAHDIVVESRLNEIISLTSHIVDCICFHYTVTNVQRRTRATDSNFTTGAAASCYVSRGLFSHSCSHFEGLQEREKKLRSKIETNSTAFQIHFICTY